ncbi:protein lin-54 homolog isoform X1 [Pieris brassicae]|uniref:protein lin-54 homolog isoform X1 n=1 Tax=Pieris brassicae TaxID=7116 RepID=UPI001E65F2F3|nr:protein lin-54 homolog isoform X1 [Pieris brassicae]XP_045524874.1 protein lin-54 homolog isoform X1 [Pieris brassicae]
MDTNLDDSLNLDSAMQVDFEQPEETVCHQDDIILDQEDIPMEFVYEEKQMLMDTTGEEIIISDFIGGQFNLQDLQNDQSELNTLNQVQGGYNLTTQSDTMLDLQLNQQIITTLPEQLQKNIVITTVQSSPRKKAEALPKPVAIAPKPSLAKLVNIVPKPVTLVSNKNINKTQTLGSLPCSTKGTFLAQIGKQILMMPSNTQKVKLISGSQANSSQVQFLPKTVSSHGKPMKIITLPASQAKMDSKQTVISKVLPNANVQPQTRYVTIKPNSSVPVSVRNKVILVSPNDQSVKLKKKQEIISLQPMAKLLPKVTAAEKVPTSALSSTQNVILKSTAPPAQVSKTADSSRTQIHQINVPGKGIQFIRLVTNSGATKSVVKQPQKIITIPKSSVVTDNSSRAADLKPPKLVKIAPLKHVRSSQSLLAPLNEPEKVQLDDQLMESFVKTESKEEIRALIEQTMSDEVSVDFKYSKIEEENSRDSSRMEQESQEHPLIVIPSSFDHTVEVKSDFEKSNESENITAALKEENDSASTYEDTNFSFNEQAIETTDLGLRPRKACNCTKSQCLKLYCDCFANGEFCNQCNCNNCFNNLENEELRQKAIRGCLDRNPHAFKPKIGKSKVGGPEIVRRHTKGCNCKRSGCLKNYCECYEARIACTAMCKCVGCRNVTDCMEQGRFERAARPNLTPQAAHLKQPCAFMTSEVIEAVCQCLVAAAEGGERELAKAEAEADPLREVIDEFARCLQDIIAAAHSSPMSHDECST